HSIVYRRAELKGGYGRSTGEVAEGVKVSHGFKGRNYNGGIILQKWFSVFKSTDEDKVRTTYSLSKKFMTKFAL
ncbi:MAG: hypothetical protein WBP00_17735, partial [Saprospiraceae bacterium]